jgi:nucleoside-diphosphate-sugar epimerase
MNIHQPQTTLIAHIFNEEYLLPFWLTHHKELFDNFVIIDYHSTDNSIDICKSICPNCKIITSRNHDFHALNVDLEVMDVENSVDGIKMVLNVTEFLICEKPIKSLFCDTTNFLSYSIIAYSPYSEKNYEVNNNQELFSGLLHSDMRYHQDREGVRTLHNFPNGKYGPGRHRSFNYSIPLNNAHIIWFGYYPMNDALLKRKTQIASQMPEFNIVRGWGRQHLYSKEKILGINSVNARTGVALKDINVDLYNLLTFKYSNQKKVALIGCCGYVGTMLYDYLITNTDLILRCYGKTSADIYPPHTSILASEITSEEIQLFDVVIYLAGLTGPEDCQACSYDKVYAMNVEEPLTLAIKMNKNQLLIYSSTACLYDNDQLISDISLFNHYEKSMYEREQQLHAVTNTHTIGLRMGSVIGVSPNMRSELFYNGNSLELFLSAITKNYIKIWNIHTRRSVLWIQDLVNAITTLIEQKHTLTCNDIFNISSCNTTIHDTAKTISDKLGCELIVLKLETSSKGSTITSERFSQRFQYTFLGTNDVIIKDLIQKKDVIQKSMNIIGKYNKCIICNSVLLVPVINLGIQPLANDFNVDKNFKNKTFSLSLNRCENCFHSQLDYFVEREVLFKNYIYKSGTSKTIHDYFSSFAELYSCKMNHLSNRNILEIACNDGSQLDEFKKRNWDTYGVDPALNIVNLNNGHNIQCGFWGKEKIHFTQTFDLIVAQNVLAHVDNPVRFLADCVYYMNDDSLLVIQTSQANMFVNNEFDTIYHEHISFFNIRSMMKLANKVGCYIEHVYKPQIHGVSYVFEIKKGNKSDVILPLLHEEETQGLYSDSFYTNYSNSIEYVKANTLTILQHYKNDGYKIIAYGAAAKGTTFLNYVFNSSPENEYIPECIIDDADLKQNTYMPGVNVIVKKIDYIDTYINDKIVILITAWNFYDEIIYKISNYIQQKSLPIQVKTLTFYPSIKEDKIA